MRTRLVAAGSPIVAGLAALVGTGLLAVGCGSGPTVDPLRREPALIATGPALRLALDRAASLAGTPAARLATRLRDRIEGCTEVVGHFPTRSSEPDATAPAASLEAVDWVDALRCREATALDAALDARLERERGAHAAYLQWPVGRTGFLALELDVDANGGLALAGRLEPDDAMGPIGFLIPAERPPAAPRIDAATALLHLHLRSASGTGLARLIPAESQGDRLFALKGRLLEGALLEGTVELGLFGPAPGGDVPLAALVLHHRGAAAISAALGEALEQLRRTWSIEPSERVFTTAPDVERTGGCYADLPLLPELAPCWVVTDEALVLGYRAEAVESVLDSRPGQPSGDDETRSRSASISSSPAGGDGMPASRSRLVVDLDRVRAVDRERMGVLEAPAMNEGRENPAVHATARLADLYDRLELSAAVANDGGIALDGALRARP